MNDCVCHFPTTTKIQALRAEIRSAMINEKGNASPIALRLAWHSSGTYDAAKGLYGNNGATMYVAAFDYLSLSG